MARDEAPAGARPAAIATPSRTQEIVRRFGIQAKKSLGQNFLTDLNVLRGIVAAAELDGDKGALEVGPGIGALTEQLAQACRRVVAVELDNRLLPVLSNTLADYPNAEVLHGDILKLDLRALLAERFAGCKAVSVVANLPYYATTPILMKLLEERLPLEHIVVMVQREVAERLEASPGTKAYGSLSVAAQYYAEIRIVARVPPTVFVPKPNVDSCVIRLTLRRSPPVAVPDEALFFRLIRGAFAQRRKTLLNNLAVLLPQLSKEELSRRMKEAGLDPGRRGETLNLA